MDKLHFIKAICHQSSREQGYQVAPNEIKEKYDHEVVFDNSVIDLVNNNIKLSDGYQELYSYIKDYSKENPTKKIITIGGDHSVSASTVAAMNEKYMRQTGDNVDSDLIILWIDAYPDLHDFKSSPNKDLNDMPAGSLLGLCGTAFTRNKLLVKSSQFIYYGLLDHDDNIDMVKEYHIPYLSEKKIRILGDNNINVIKEMIKDKPVHVSLDMKVFNSSVTQSVIPVNDKGLNVEQIEKLLIAIKDNIVAFDVTEFNPCVGSKESSKLTREIIRYLLSRTFDMKEKSINIFTEDSQFLIYRPVNQENPHADIGWYILKGLDLETRNNIINEIDNDDIEIIEIEDEEYFITKTTMNEQYGKSYHCAKTIHDTTLFPEEKLSMCFELLNTK